MSDAEIMKARRDHLTAKIGDVRVDEDPAEKRAPTELVERSQSNAYLNKLSPPAGTNYWRHQSFPIMRSQDLTYNYTSIFGGSSSELMSTLTWRVDAYVYATNTRPSSDFASQGGAIYVVLVHSGAAATGQVVGGGIEYRYNVSLRYTRPGTSALKQLPPSYSATHSGDTWNYPISFTQDMQMFNNGGNDIFTFPAQYEDSLDLHKGQQTGFVKDQIETQWGVVLDDYPDFYTNFGFGSVSVFTFTDLDKFTFDCKASVHSNSSSQSFEMCSVTRSITVDCTFPSS